MTVKAGSALKAAIAGRGTEGPVRSGVRAAERRTVGKEIAATAGPDQSGF